MPSPALPSENPATNSPTIAPITDKPEATLSPVIMLGMAVGKRNLSTVSPSFAPYSRNRSESRGSTLRNPAKVLAMIGNTDTMNADTATARSPGPNHNTSNGATATIGTVCKNSAYGYSPRSSQRDKEKTKPTVVPRLALSKNPSTAPCAVVSSAEASGARSVHAASNTSEGGGTKNRGTEKARTTLSQIAITITNVSAGGNTDGKSSRSVDCFMR